MNPLPSRDENPFESTTLNTWGVPISLLGAFFLQKIWFFKALSILLAVIPFHEMGHAITAWMGGRWAFPLGAMIPSAGMTWIGFERSPPVTAFWISAFAFLGYQAFQKRVYFLFVLSISAILSSIYLSFLISNETLDIWISLGGIAGEMILTSLLISGFYHNFFESWRWSFFRIPIMLYSSLAFAHTFAYWRQIESQTAKLPFGSAISSDGARDAGGDLNRLLAAGWTEEQITSFYLLILKSTLLWIAINFLFGLWKSYRTPPGADSNTLAQRGTV